MSSSEAVTVLRKAGKLDEAYQLALQLNNQPNPDIWDIRAFGWCLVALVERDISAGNYSKLEEYARQLERINVEESSSTDGLGIFGISTGTALTSHSDELLISRRNRALALVSRAIAKLRSGNSGPLLTYKDVYIWRKKDTDKAYRIALEIAEMSSPGELELHALAWCLIDLIKRDFTAGRYQELEHYGQRLQKIVVDARQNDVLAKQQAYALSMCEPSAPTIFQARVYSKQENYAEAIRCYNRLLPGLPQKYHTSLGWDLYRHSRKLHTLGQHTIPQIKRNLQQYLQLDIERPSQLHSAILWLAKEIAKADKLDLAAFLRLWGGDTFREEDFERAPAKDGRQYPALAEDAVQRAIKSATKSNNIGQMEYIVPFLEAFINRYPDNQWLVYYKAKALVLLGRTDEAQKYCRSVCKRKPNEFWAWSLLGDAYGSDRQAALACYAKALLCPAEDDKTITLRVKMAQLLAELGYNEQAKYEISICTQLKPHNTPKEITRLMEQDRFHETVSPSSNMEFYTAQAAKAEELLLADIPWQDAVVGDCFTRPGKDGKPDQIRRKIYVQSSPYAREVTHPERKFPHPELPAGSAICVKGEGEPGESYKILAFARRECDTPWDIFLSHIGVITFVNIPKRVYHLLVDRGIEVFFSFDMLDSSLSEGDFVSAKVAYVLGEKGKQYRVVSANQTMRSPSVKIYKPFGPETVRISGEIGFTDSNIFIPPHLVRENALKEDDEISGTALLSFNKKKSEWGWKALTIKKNIDPLEEIFKGKQTKDVCLAAVMEDGFSLQHITNQTEEICLEAVRQNGFALQFVEDQTPDIRIAAVRQNGLAIQHDRIVRYADELLFADIKAVKEIFTVPPKQDAPLHYSSSLDGVEEICLAAVKQNGLALQYISMMLQTEDLCRVAVQQNGLALQYAAPSTHTEELYLLAVQKNGLALQYVGEQTESICLAAIKENTDAFHFIANPTPDIVKAIKLTRPLN